jgi:hypothetical protein
LDFETPPIPLVHPSVDRTRKRGSPGDTSSIEREPPFGHWTTQKHYGLIGEKNDLLWKLTPPCLGA